MKRLRRWYLMARVWWRVQRHLSRGRRWKRAGFPSMAAKYTALALAEIELLRRARKQL